MADLLARQFDGITALVTGANRGLGKEFTQVLLDAGAAKVYAAARDPSTIEVTDTRVVPVRLDITNPGGIAAAARDCTDVSLVINNAGAMLQTPFVSALYPRPTCRLRAPRWRRTTSAPWRWLGRSPRRWASTTLRGQRKVRCVGPIHPLAPIAFDRRHPTRAAMSTVLPEQRVNICATAE
jgi:NAD(P)-dependent dehydrogenase (short-subunit alcohol dehydrogenase family)